jgi:hypothetical protein
VPGWLPDPRTMLAARLKVEAIDLSASHYDYLEQYCPERLKGYTADQTTQLRIERGSVVNLLVQIQGKKHGNVRLDYVAFSSAGRLLNGPRPSEGFRAGTPNDQWLAPIFVDAPLLPGGKLVKAFSLRFRLFDGDVLLAIADTPRIVSWRSAGRRRDRRR